MRKPLVAGNWKMNGSRDANRELLSALQSELDGLAGVELAVCPPAVYLPEVVEALADSPIEVGGQDCSDQASGAYTGEVAAAMLKDVGCRYVIVGHSERRDRQAEDSAWVAAKYQAALAAGVTPILCVGEQKEEREAGRTEAVVGEQLDAVLDAAGVESLDRAVIAYEPVWAIGTGLTATPEQAAEVHAFIRNRVAGRDPRVAADLRILYGGSMKADNAAGLLAHDDIDGGLVGGASLDAANFAGIARAATGAGE
ncbi:MULTISPECIES: triose-phosphate isomerase [Thioalkalivibrio]|uniref:Triosephosphate isomerase n=1 Tax=Thioalkalivibrio halophilus TaxID=252474 RepID=A0A1V3A138_9GAMM|nr:MULTISPECIES: triose-phosphate isomerase [Thioalkalivibrio]OOC11019.1 triose-phosphate isomerase [Thioalkalivibrio halophilus]PYG02649.1 triosephosphate isomerase [Thioalkalivibrio sp. ALE21]